MDGREAMALSGSPYYIHRGVAGSGSGSGTQSGLLGFAGFRTLSGSSAAVQSNVGGSLVGSTFPVQPSSTISPHGHGANTGVVSGVPPGETVPRKRGRPRKYGPDGTVKLALSPLSSTPTPGSLAPTQKRGRGRPPGTGRKQRLAILGEWISSSAGMGFSPHVITIEIGEDIAAKIISFSQQRPRAMFILSASGAVSTVTLRQPAATGGAVTYKGRFEILCLSGSYLLNDNGGPRSRTGGLSVSLSSPDGCVIGGGIGGVLIAASPVQVVVGSFVYGGSKTKNKTSTGPKSDGDSNMQTDDKTATLASSPPSQSLTNTSVMGGWPGSRSMDMRNTNIDIDLMRG